MRRTRVTATTGWVVIALYVTAWDFYMGRRGETLSAGFRAASRHPVTRWPVIVAWAITTAHLFGWIPDRVDPYRAVGRLGARCYRS